MNRLGKYKDILEPLRVAMDNLETIPKSEGNQAKYDNLSFELHKQEDLFQELVLEYNKLSKNHKVFVNSSLSNQIESESGVRIFFKKNTFGTNS